MVAVNQLYTHYRDPHKFYKVLALGLQEATEEVCVIYQNVQDTTVWVRNIDSWLATVEHDGHVVPRFKLVE